MATVNIDIAKESSVQAVKTDTEEIKTAAGSTGDSGGTASGGSVFAKLNKIISDLATHMGRWTSERAAKLDAIGSTTDTGGSETAGTVMAKLNAVQTGLAGIKPEYEFTNTIAAEMNIFNTYTEDAPYSYTGSGIFKINKQNGGQYIYLKIDNGSWLRGDNFPDGVFLKFNTKVQAYGTSNSYSYATKLTILV